MIPSIEFKDVYGLYISREINDFLMREIFIPLLKVINEDSPDRVKLSAKDLPEMYLMKKIQKGDVLYDGTGMYGKFDARSSKLIRDMGGVWDAKKKRFRLPPGKLTPNIKVAISASQERLKKMHDGLKNQLDNVEATIEPKIEALDLSQGLEKVVQGLQTQIKNAMDAIGVEIKLMPDQEETIKKTYTDNMKLYIKEWAQEDIKKLRGQVEANASAGYRYDRVKDLLESHYGASKAKAEFLAYQETSLFMAKFRRERFQGAGVNFYRWQAVMDKKTRTSHRELNNKIFKFGEPPIVNQKGDRKEPGEDFRCLPGDSRIDFVHGIEKCFRRWYSGNLTTIITTSGKTIRATPNHPVLTTRGWKPIDALNNSDYLVDLSEELLDAPEAYRNKRIPTISEIFETHRKAGASFSFKGQADQFHGDGSDSEIDVINSTGFLRIDWQAKIKKFFGKLTFATTDFLASCFGGRKEALSTFVPAYVFGSDMRSGGQLLALGKRETAHSDAIGFGTASNGNARIEQAGADDRSIKTCSFRDGKFALTGEISIDDGFWVKLQSVMRVTADRIASVRNDLFNGHVFNLQTDLGYYTTAGVIVSNCRCKARPILEPVHKVGDSYVLV